MRSRPTAISESPCFYNNVGVCLGVCVWVCVALCVYVNVSVRTHISKVACPNFAKFD